MGIPILEGSGEPPPGAGEDSDESYVVVNEVFARRYAGSVVGRRMALPGNRARDTPTIVGVAASVRGHGLADDEERVQYYAVTPEHGTSSRFVLRTSGSPSAALEPASRRLLELDPLVRVWSATTGPEILRSETADQRFLAVLLGLFGALAVGIAVLGVFGTVSLAVRRRIRETGVWLALGAGRGRVVRHVLLLGVEPLVPGLIAGIAGALALTRYLAPALYGVKPLGPASLIAAVLLLGGAALAACLLPARRALRADPVRILREE